MGQKEVGGSMIVERAKDEPEIQTDDQKAHALNTTSKKQHNANNECRTWNHE